MKKAYIIIGVIALIAIGIFGTAAANPDAAQGVVQKLDAIISAITSLDDDMGADMTALKNDIGSIKSDIADLKETKGDVLDLKNIVGTMSTTMGTIDTSLISVNNNMVKMEKIAGSLEVGANASDYQVMGDYGEIRHVVLSIFAAPPGLDEGVDKFSISVIWSPGNETGEIVARFNYLNDGVTTLEFNAQKWLINYQSDNIDGFTLHYAVTTTY